RRGCLAAPHPLGTEPPEAQLFSEPLARCLVGLVLELELYEAIALEDLHVRARGCRGAGSGALGLRFVVGRRSGRAGALTTLQRERRERPGGRTTRGGRRRCRGRCRG